jgi:uncharacterized protein YbjT (DUF2867 family)
LRIEKIALVAGATGLVGGHCLNLLLNSPDYKKVYSITRREIKNENPKLVQIIADFDKFEEVIIPEKPDVVYCCLGTTIKKAGSQANFRRVDYDYTMSLALLAEKMAVSQFFLVSSVGSDKNSLIFYSRVKGEIENALKNMNFENVNIIRPGLILGKREEARPGEEIAAIFAKPLNNLLFGPLKKYRSIEAIDIAKAMINISAKNLKGYHIFETDKLEDFAFNIIK